MECGTNDKYYYRHPFAANLCWFHCFRDEGWKHYDRISPNGDPLDNYWGNPLQRCNYKCFLQTCLRLRVNNYGHHLRILVWAGPC